MNECYTVHMTTLSHTEANKAKITSSKRDFNHNNKLVLKTDQIRASIYNYTVKLTCKLNTDGVFVCS